MNAFGPMSSNWKDENMDEEPNAEAKKFFDLLEARKKTLYEGCVLSSLSVVSRFINIKCEFNHLNKAVNNVLALMKEMCPVDNEMTDTYYSAKKLLAALQLPHKRIDTCPNGCLLYWKDKIDLDRCKHCGANRYEKKTLRGKDIAKKVLIYFSVGLTLQRMYATKSTAEQMRWQYENSHVRGSMAHPCDSEA